MKRFFSAQRETPYSSNLPLPPLCNSMYLSTEFSYFLWASHKFLFLPCFLFISGLSSLICFQGFNIILALVFWIFLSPLLTRLCLLRTAFWHVSLEVLFYPLKFREDKTKLLIFPPLIWELLKALMFPETFCPFFLCIFLCAIPKLCWFLESQNH